MENNSQLLNSIIEGIQEKKGKRITIADLDGIDGTICRYFVICEGNTPMQVEAITDSIEEIARTKGGEKPVHIVGRENGVWVAMDYTDVIVHIFVPETRSYYDLANLWQDAKLTEIEDLD